MATTVLVSGTRIAVVVTGRWNGRVAAKVVAGDLVAASR
jgi:hypothetical protein